MDSKKKNDIDKYTTCTSEMILSDLTAKQNTYTRLKTKAKRRLKKKIEIKTYNRSQTFTRKTN